MRRTGRIFELCRAGCAFRSKAKAQGSPIENAMAGKYAQKSSLVEYQRGDIQPGNIQ
jgi:hypothetical protein